MLYDRYSTREIRDAARKWGWRYVTGMGKAGHAALVHDDYPSVTMPAVGRKGRDTHPAVLKKLTGHHGVSVQEFMAGPPKRVAAESQHKESDTMPTIHDRISGREMAVTSRDIPVRMPKKHTISYAILEAITHGATDVRGVIDYFNGFGCDLAKTTKTAHRITSLVRIVKSTHVDELEQLGIEFGLSEPDGKAFRGRMTFKVAADTPELPHGSWVEGVRAKYRTTKKVEWIGKAETKEAAARLNERATTLQGASNTPLAPGIANSEATMFEVVGVTLDNKVLVRGDDGKLYKILLEVV